MNKLYYTVKADETLQEVKIITVYTIDNNLPKIFCEIEAYLNAIDETEIQTYLDNNGYENEYEFILL